jgi:hypothetical protein
LRVMHVFRLTGWVRWVQGLSKERKVLGLGVGFSSGLF